MMYQSSGFFLPPAIKNIILANLAIYFFQETIAISMNDSLMWLIPDNYLYNPLQHPSVFNLVFGVVPKLMLDRFYLWQPFTYMFLHGDLLHFGFNMFIIWMFGRELEGSWGSREFLRYYLFTGLIAGMTIFLWNWKFSPGSTTIGASGAVFGVMAAYALFFPERYVYYMFMFPIKVKYLVLGFALLEFFYLPSVDGISHIGHLGGLIGGYFYIRHYYRHYGIGASFFRDFFKKKDYF